MAFVIIGEENLFCKVKNTVQKQKQIYLKKKQNVIAPIEIFDAHKLVIN